MIILEQDKIKSSELTIELLKSNSRPCRCAKRVPGRLLTTPGTTLPGKAVDPPGAARPPRSEAERRRLRPDKNGQGNLTTPASGILARALPFLSKRAGGVLSAVPR